MTKFVTVTPYDYDDYWKAHKKRFHNVTINRDNISKIFPKGNLYEVRMVAESPDDWIRVDREDYLRILNPGIDDEYIDVGMP